MCIICSNNILLHEASSQKLVWEKREAGSTEALVTSVSVFVTRQKGNFQDFHLKGYDLHKAMECSFGEE